jgi:acyl carrier protein
LSVGTERKLKQIIVDLLKVDPEEVKADTIFVDDLGVDSLDTTVLASAFEKAFGIELPEEVAPTLWTVQDVLTYIDAHQERD